MSRAARALACMTLAASVIAGCAPEARRATSTATTPPVATPNASAAQAISEIPAAAFDQAGTTGIGGPHDLPPGAEPLVREGKPEVLFVCAEYSPFCAAANWPLIAALSRFGEFSGLEEGESARLAEYPETETLSFRDSAYSSDYLMFTPVVATIEELPRGDLYVPPGLLAPSQEALVDLYDGPPYVPKRFARVMPFLDFGNRFVWLGGYMPPAPLNGKSATEIAAASADPDTEIGDWVLRNANMISAAICEMTRGEPADVCTSPGVAQGTETLLACDTLKECRVPTS